MVRLVWSHVEAGKMIVFSKECKNVDTVDICVPGRKMSDNIKVVV